jgi:gamma-glutamylcyclotransferase (GGCT)/AIG2-like uncharacterized protein YtfP
MGERIRSTGSFEVLRTTGSGEPLDRLFVYGTLRQGQTARSLIESHITRSVKASTTGAIYVFPMGYSAFVEADEPNPVIGELLWLADLAATFGLLDAYEGPEFARVIRQVRIDPAPHSLVDLTGGVAPRPTGRAGSVPTPHDSLSLVDAGELVWSWIYVLAEPDAIKHGTLIDHGDWVRYWNEQRTSG